MKLGDFEISVIRDGLFRLDGGAMFGVVPRVLWEKIAPPDDKNRIRMGLNALLVRTGDHNVLIDTGIGDKWDEKSLSIYGIEKPETLTQSVERAGLTVEQIDTVVLTHLHFDHCGGSTRWIGDTMATGRGEPDSVHPLNQGDVPQEKQIVSPEARHAVPTFPNATYTVQRGDWDVAHNTHERNRGSYIGIDFDPLHDAGQLRFLDGDVEVVPGIRTQVTGGHARYHSVVFVESAGATALFLADIVPMACHLRLPYIMGYDLYPEETLEVKRRLLKDACDGGWVNIFEHDRDTPACILGRDGHNYIVKETIEC